ncbi:hypothetical protein RHGRI_017160 [Rhododendron griersonianum]|uniref:Uncharacterized protein n=1 Tax=Rhododendron griersonianum TaxID=479676 RepID=A0AAV6JWT4_9ERIC|nr:hypothetical protein RHGRI_017160 [Rhododendron griersonianum]
MSSEEGQKRRNPQLSTDPDSGSSLSSLHGSTPPPFPQPSTPSKPTTMTAASPPKAPPTSPLSAPPNFKTSSKVIKCEMSITCYISLSFDALLLRMVIYVY